MGRPLSQEFDFIKERINEVKNSRDLKEIKEEI